MKLSHLIKQANKIYDLALGDDETRELQRRLVAAGYDSTVSLSSTPAIIDAVLQTTDSLRSSRQVVASVYSGMKVEAAAEQDGCPRCHQPMRRVELVNERRADYCQICAITLPTRA